VPATADHVDGDNTAPILLPPGFGDDRRQVWLLTGEGLAALAVLLGILSAIVVFVPSGGHVSEPLHDALAWLLGRATFVVPLALLGLGIVALVHRFQPWVPVPTPRLIGLGLIVLGALPAQRLLAPGSEPAAGTGVAGQWLAGTLQDALGLPASAVVLASVLLVGVLLALDLSLADVAGRLWVVVASRRRRTSPLGPPPGPARAPDAGGVYGPRALPEPGRPPRAP
jgi:4TM region of DNA translocase FtsK/SpoIIIE